jgi:hypothetical protein
MIQLSSAIVNSQNNKSFKHMLRTAILLLHICESLHLARVLIMSQARNEQNDKFAVNFSTDS